MTDVKSDKTNSTDAGSSRCDVLKATSVGAVGAATPKFFTQNPWALPLLLFNKMPWQRLS